MESDREIGESEAAEQTRSGGAPLPERRWLPWFVGVMATSVLLRLLAMLTTSVRVEPDYSGYSDVADALRSLDFSADWGFRAPGYPLFLLLCGNRPTVVGLVQLLLLGPATTALVFFIVWKVARRPGWASLAAALYGLNIMQVFYEMTLLTEAFSAFLLTAAVAVLVAHRADPQRSTLVKLVGLGLLVSWLALTRPVFLFVPVVLLAPLLVGMRGHRKAVVWFAVAALLPVLAWSGFNKYRLDYFGLTVTFGYSLVNHVGEFIEKAPDQWATIRDVYVQQRRPHPGYEQSNQIWEARDDLIVSTGLSSTQLSGELADMSLWLIVHDPGAYARQVVRGSALFWAGEGRYDRQWRWSDESPGRYFWLAQKYVWIALSAVFLIVVVVTTVELVTSQQARTGEMLLWWSIAAIPLLTCLLSNLVELGITRFGMPVQPLVAVAVCLRLADYVGRHQRTHTLA